MLSKQQIISDMFDFLESKGLVEEFIEIYVSKYDSVEYKELYETR